MSFKNQAEIYRALLDGMKIKSNFWEDGSYICLSDGWLCNQKGESSYWQFSNLKAWSIYEEPNEDEEYLKSILGKKFIYNGLGGIVQNINIDEKRICIYDVWYSIENFKIDWKPFKDK